MQPCKKWTGIAISSRSEIVGSSASNSASCAAFRASSKPRALGPQTLTSVTRGQVVTSRAETFYTNPTRALNRIGRNRFDVVSITPPYEEVPPNPEP